jgi:hypothetical protein
VIRILCKVKKVTGRGELGGEAFREQYSEMISSRAPIFNGTSPALGNILHSQVHEFDNRLLIREDSLSLDNLSQRAIEGFNGIGGVRDLTDGHRVIKDGDHMLPITEPDLADSGVFLIPGLSKGLESILSLCQGGSLVNWA